MTSPPKSSTGLKRFLKRVVLELAFARLIADRAIERVIDEQHLEHALSRLERLVSVHTYHLTFGDRRCTRGRELWHLLNFDETHSAHAHDR